MAKKQHTWARAKRKRNAKRALDNRVREQQAAATEPKAAAPAKRARAAKKKTPE